MLTVEAAQAVRPVIEIAGLRKSFGTNEVLKGIDLAVTPGEVRSTLAQFGGQAPEMRMAA